MFGISAYRFSSLMAAVLICGALRGQAQVLTLTAPQNVEVFRALPPLAPSVRTPMTYIGVRWTDRSNNEQSFSIQRRVNGAWVDVGNAPANSQEFVLAVNSSFPLPTIPVGHSDQFEFRVKAASFWGSSAWASGYLAADWSFPRSAQRLPTPAAFVASRSGSAVRFAWRDADHNEPNGIRYVIQYARDGGDWQELVRLPANCAQYDWTNPAVSAMYRFRIFMDVETRDAQRYFAKSELSNEVYVSTAPANAPTAPMVTDVAADSPTVAHVYFFDASTNETDFVFERAVSASGPWTLVGTIASSNFPGLPSETGNLEITDDALTPNTQYCYRVRARNAAGDSAPSNSDCVMMPAAAPSSAAPPAPPTYLSVAAIGPHKVQLRWRDNSSNETQFEVQRKINNGVWESLGNVPTEDLHRDSANSDFIDISDEGDDVPAGASCCYQVRALNNAGDSAFTPSACATTPAQATTSIRVLNNTSYALVSLKIGGVEQMPGTSALPVGYQYTLPVSAGTVRVEGWSGYLQGSQEHVLYSFAVDVPVANAQSVDVPINNPTIHDLATRFTNHARTYTSVMEVGMLTTTYTITFYPDTDGDGRGKFEWRQDGVLRSDPNETYFADTNGQTADYPGASSLSSDNPFFVTFHLTNSGGAGLIHEQPNGNYAAEVVFAGLYFCDSCP